MRKIRLAFHRLDATPDEYGNTSSGWSETPFLTVWAELRETMARERMEGGRLDSAQTAKAYIRFSPESQAITTADQARSNGREYNIRGIVNINERNRTLELTLERGVG